MMTSQIRRTHKKLYVLADFVRGEEQHGEIFCTEGENIPVLHDCRFQFVICFFPAEFYFLRPFSSLRVASF